MGHAPPIRWDVVEEHLDEAAFLHQLWEESLRSPKYNLQEIAEGPEERMLAHLDGLVVGGSRVAKTLLIPSLASEEPGVVFAAAFALLASEDGDFTNVVLSALERAPASEARAPIVRALSVVPRPDLGARLAALAVEGSSPVQGEVLGVLGELRVDPGVRLEPLAASGEHRWRALALRLARLMPGRLDPLVLERALSDDEESVRDEALRSGLALRTRGAFAAAEAAVVGGIPPFATAALLLGLSGDERSLGPLVRALGNEATRAPAVFALGFSGLVTAADALVDAMSIEELAPLAAEGFAAVTGLAVAKEFARPPRRWSPAQPEGPEERHGPEADLPKPEPATISAWWKEARQRLDPSQRWLRGQSWRVEAVLDELEVGPARRREALALELAIRTRGQIMVSWNAPSTRQRTELIAARRSGSSQRPGKSFRDDQPGDRPVSKALT